MHDVQPDRGAARQDGWGSPDAALAQISCAGASMVREVFRLIWPEAGIECHDCELGLRVDVRMKGLRHVVQIPRAFLEFDRGIILVRAVYRAGLPDELQRAAASLSLSL